MYKTAIDLECGAWAEARRLRYCVLLDSADASHGHLSKVILLHLTMLFRSFEIVTMLHASYELFTSTLNSGTYF